MNKFPARNSEDKLMLPLCVMTIVVPTNVTSNPTQVSAVNRSRMKKYDIAAVQTGIVAINSAVFPAVVRAIPGVQHQIGMIRSE